MGRNVECPWSPVGFHPATSERADNAHEGIRQYVEKEKILLGKFLDGSVTSVVRVSFKQILGFGIYKDQKKAR